MKLLITGGAGFMGSNFIRYILKEYPSYVVVNYDKLTYSGNLDNLKDIDQNPNYRFVQGDICDSQVVEKLVQKVDIVINYAAETHVDRSILDPSAFIKTDVLGTYILLEAVKKYKIQRFIQISTDEVFGSIQEGLFTEESPFLPNSPYAASKAGGDLLCRAYNITYKTPVIVTHSCNFYGPYHYPEKFIPLAITNLLQNKKVPVYGDGLQVREWVYTKDHCRAVDLIVHKGKIGEVYNISSEEEWKNIEVAKLILKTLHKNESFVEYVNDRPAHDRRYALDSSKLKKLGWRTEYSFERGMQLTVAWFRDNQWWWEKIVNSKDYKNYYNKQYGTV